MAWDDRLFRALLRLLPEEFRAGYARDMEATFRTERREAGGRRTAGSRRRLLRLWGTTALDILRTAPGEHLDVLSRDLRFAARTMAGRPVHTLAAILTLAIGIGANVAMFSVADAVLLAPLPYHDPSALVTVEETRGGGDASTMGYLSFVDLRARSRSFSHLAATGASTATITGDGLDAARVNAVRVSRDYFDMLGVAPLVGRTFTEAEDAPGAARRVVVLSYALWQRRFASRPDVVGQPVLIGEIPHTVVGVMPASFDDLVSARLYRGAELWYPLGYDPAAPFACRTCRHLRVFGRLAPGVSPEMAEREISSVFAALEQEHPADYHEAGGVVTPLPDFFLGPVRPVLFVLWAGVGLLLAVACSNVANLLLLRASERSHEVAVRTALGVTRGRLARQLLTESFLLALMGGAAGLAPAWLAIRALVLAGPAEIPRLADAALDGRAIAVAVGVAGASGIVFGVVPLLQLVRREGSQTLRGAGRRTEPAGTWRVRAALVAGNVALAALLLVGSGLLVRSLTTLLAVEPGFDSSRTLTLQMALGGAKYKIGSEPQKEIATVVQFYDEVLRRTAALPGVESAAATTTLPLGGSRDRFGLHIEERPHANPEEAPSADRFAVTPGLLETLRVPLLRGRLIDARDGQSAESVAVINETLADDLFAGEDPLGRRVMLGSPTAPPRTIVGIVGDVRHEGLDVPPADQVWVPQAQWAWAESNMTIVVRARGDAAALAGSVRAIVRDLGPEQPVTAVRLYDDIVAASMGTRRFAAWLLGVFAATALTLAVVGLYGALAVMVGQRRREVGVRIALGAGAADIRRLVLAQGMRPALLGLATGLVAAAASARVPTSLLYGVRALDPMTFVVASLTLLASAVAACLVPAWRAAQVDPASALRSE